MPASKHRKSTTLLLCLIALSVCAPLASQQQNEAPRVLVHPAAPETAAPVRQSYAVVIGISSYPHLPEKDQLLYAERDAELVRSTLTAAASGEFLPENVHTLLGAKATLANIRHELEEWLPSVAAENDRALVYFAGRGYIHQGRTFLAPADVDPSDLARSGYPVEELDNVLAQKIRARRKVLFTDARHGGVTPESTDASQLNASLNFRSSLFSLSASRYRETSVEDARWGGGGHGVFAFYLARAWRARPIATVTASSAPMSWRITRAARFARRPARSRIPPSTAVMTQPWRWFICRKLPGRTPLKPPIRASADLLLKATGTTSKSTSMAHPSASSTATDRRCRFWVFAQARIPSRRSRWATTRLARATKRSPPGKR
jgi:Caspase domain